MKFGRILTMLAAVVFALLCGVGGAAFAADYVEGEVLVVLEVPSVSMNTAKSDMSAFASSVSSQASSFAGSVGLASVGTYAEIARVSGKNIVHLRSATKSTEELIRELKGDPRVVSVQPNHISKLSAVPSATTPNDPLYSSLWGMRTIKADEVWDDVSKGRGNGSVVVAVIDSGIWAAHPDLASNMATDSFGNAGRHFYKDGTVDDATFDPNVAFPNVRGAAHGTHVAGTIGAVGNNGIGVAGVAWKVKLLAVNVFTFIENLNDIIAYDSDTISGINYVLAQREALNIRVANMSLGSWRAPEDEDISAFGEAIKSMCNVGILVAIAAGNEGQDISNPDEYLTGWRPYPASFKFSSTISVGATDNADRKASYSNYSNAWVDIAAPGSGILSTVSTGGYASMNGTSMATPHVAGAAALLFMAYPNETAVQIKNRILDNADGVGVAEGYWASGRLNLKAAFNNKRDPVPVESVTVTPTAKTLRIGGSFDVVATITPAHATSRDVNWDSDKPDIATVSTTGKVMGVKAGDAKITVTTVDGNKKATCVVTVALKYQDPDLPIGTPEDVESSEPEGMSISEAFDKLGGKFESLNFETNQNGDAVLKYEVVKTAAAGALDGKREDVKHALSLPVFMAQLTKAGVVAAVPFTFSGSSFFAKMAGDINLLKIRSSGVGEMFKFTSVPKDVGDGMFAVQKAGETDFYSGAIDVNAQYKLLLFIKDGGEFDLDGKADGSVMDPAALLKIDAVGSGGGGGGGCSAAYLPFTLLLAVPLIFRKKK